jgi:AcrR family transcriptional regulator
VGKEGGSKAVTQRARKPQSARRAYESPLRRQQAAETRERIVSAGVALAREIPSWDWRDLTFRAVAEGSGVSERTVYRYFSTERELHVAIMNRLEQEAGVSYEHMAIDEISDVAARVFTAMARFAAPPPRATEDDPTFLAEDLRRQDALVRVVSDATTGWSEDEERLVSAMLDILWSVPTYVRLTSAWGFDSDDAMRGTEWALGLLVDGIRAGLRPPVGARGLEPPSSSV